MKLTLFLRIPVLTAACFFLTACAVKLPPILQVSFKHCALPGCGSSVLISPGQSARLQAWLRQRETGWAPSAPFPSPQLELTVVAGSASLSREVAFATPVWLQLQGNEMVIYRKGAYTMHLNDAERSELLAILNLNHQ